MSILFEQLLEALTLNEEKESGIEYSPDAYGNSEFKQLKDDFEKFVQLKNIETESSKYRDIIEFLENNDQEYFVYLHKTDPGCTIFYNGKLEESLNEETISARPNMDKIYELKDRFKISSDILLDDLLKFLPDSALEDFAEYVDHMMHDLDEE